MIAVHLETLLVTCEISDFQFKFSSMITPKKTVSVTFAPCKRIRIPESRNFLLVESGILGFGIRNPALGIRNPTKDLSLIHI